MVQGLESLKKQNCSDLTIVSKCEQVKRKWECWHMRQYFTSHNCQLDSDLMIKVRDRFPRDKHHGGTAGHKDDDDIFPVFVLHTKLSSSVLRTEHRLKTITLIGSAYRGNKGHSIEQLYHIESDF